MGMSEDRRDRGTVEDKEKGDRETGERGTGEMVIGINRGGGIMNEGIKTSNKIGEIDNKTGRG